MSSDCIFCQIVAGEKPAHRVFEDDEVIAFMDIFPAIRGHVLVAPKAHAETIFDITDAAARAVTGVTRRVSAAIGRTIEPDGLSVVQANGPAAGQTVMHYHVHVLPRMAGHKLRLHGPRQGSPDELDATARLIADALD